MDFEKEIIQAVSLIDTSDFKKKCQSNSLGNKILSMSYGEIEISFCFKSSFLILEIPLSECVCYCTDIVACECDEINQVTHSVKLTSRQVAELMQPNLFTT